MGGGLWAAGTRAAPPRPCFRVRQGLAHLESSSRQALVSTGLSVFTMHVMADTTPASSSFFTRARTKAGLSWEGGSLAEGPQLTGQGEGDRPHSPS